MNPSFKNKCFARGKTCRNRDLKNHFAKFLENLLANKKKRPEPKKKKNMRKGKHNGRRRKL